MSVVNNHYIFSHAPKCGGTSVSSVVGGVNHELPMHPPSQVLKLMYPGLPTVGFVRDPWHRMVSLYFFVSRKQENIVHNKRRYDLQWMREVGFRQWLLTGADYIDSDPVCGNWFDWKRREYVQRASGGWEGLDSGAYMKYGLPPLQQRPAMWWHYEADFVGKTETMQADMDWFCHEHGAPRVTIPHRNKTNGKPSDWRSLYDREMIDFVAHFHKDDIEEGKYKWTS